MWFILCVWVSTMQKYPTTLLEDDEVAQAYDLTDAMRYATHTSHSNPTLLLTTRAVEVLCSVLPLRTA